MWKGPQFSCPGLHFPEAVSAQIYFLRKVASSLQLSGSLGSRRYGIWSVREAPLSRFRSVWSRLHLGLDFSGVKVGQGLGTLKRRDGPAWASSSWRQSEKGRVKKKKEKGGAPLRDRVWELSEVEFVVGSLRGRGTLRSSDFRVVLVCDHSCDHGLVVCSSDLLILTLQFFRDNVLCPFFVFLLFWRAPVTILKFTWLGQYMSHQNIKWKKIIEIRDCVLLETPTLFFFFFTLCYSIFHVCYMDRSDTGNLERCCWRRQRHWAIKWKVMSIIQSSLAIRSEKCKLKSRQVTRCKNLRIQQPGLYVTLALKTRFLFSTFHMSSTLI